MRMSHYAEVGEDHTGWPRRARGAPAWLQRAHAGWERAEAAVWQKQPLSQALLGREAPQDTWAERVPLGFALASPHAVRSHRKALRVVTSPRVPSWVWGAEGASGEQVSESPDLLAPQTGVGSQTYTSGVVMSRGPEETRTLGGPTGQEGSKGWAEPGVTDPKLCAGGSCGPGDWTVTPSGQTELPWRFAPPSKAS